jgi:glutamyl-tRNA synthetase
MKTETETPITPGFRVRYAPSPTGFQHIGGLRTALFNYLASRSAEAQAAGGGRFILREEDTDRTRCEERYEKNIFDTFDWLGFRWDEGPDTGGPVSPYVQSERSDLYKKFAGELLAAGRAYRCFCTAERIEEVRKAREAAHSSESGYDRHCRAVSAEESDRRAAAGEPFTVRLKIPLGEKTRFADRLLGDIEWLNDDVSPDPVLLKSDGFPTYHLANIVDDHLMGITHVMRAQEWVASTPLHVILYQAFGWEPPVFCHLPMVMGQDGKKLSKRHGATSVNEFRDAGYLPEALINYVATLGASYIEGKEIYTLEELAASFSLDKLNKAPAVFDYQKLQWYNGQYIRLMCDDDLAAHTLALAQSMGLFGAPGDKPTEEQRQRYSAAMPLVKERAVFLKEIPEKLEYLFKTPPVAPAAEFIPKKADQAKALELLNYGRELVPLIAAALSDDAAEAIVKEKAAVWEVKLGDLLMPLRVAVTGSRVSPPLFGSIRLLGEYECLARVDNSLGVLQP